MKKYREFLGSSSSSRGKEEKKEHGGGAGFGPKAGEMLINPDSGFLGDPLSFISI